MTFVTGEKNSRGVNHIFFYLSTDKWEGQDFFNDGSNIIEEKIIMWPVHLLSTNNHGSLPSKGSTTKSKIFFFPFERVEEKDSEIMVLFVQGVVSIL